jgi:hypothetical protein
MSNPKFGKYASRGGRARAKKLSKRARSASASNAAKTRWMREKLKKELLHKILSLSPLGPI